jgi:hypothetical protein
LDDFQIKSFPARIIARIGDQAGRRILTSSCKT